MDPEATTLQVHSYVLARRAEHCRFLITPTESRKPSRPSAGHKVSDEFVRFVAVNATPRAMMTREIEKVSAEDEEFSELRHRIKTGTVSSTGSPRHYGPKQMARWKGRSYLF